MATQFPAGIDNLATLPRVYDLVDGINAEDINRVRDAVVAVQTELGINPSGSYSTVKDRFDALDATISAVAGESYSVEYSATVNTTDATPTTLYSHTTASNKVYFIETRVSSIRTSGTFGTANDRSSFLLRASVKNDAGSLTIYEVTNEYTSRDQAAWDCDIEVSGVNILVRVTGAAGNNITWIADIKVQSV